jgi:hypothetical protein
LAEVEKEDEKEIKSVNLNGLVPYLQQPIKELKAELDSFISYAAKQSSEKYNTSVIVFCTPEFF